MARLRFVLWLTVIWALLTVGKVGPLPVASPFCDLAFLSELCLHTCATHLVSIGEGWRCGICLLMSVPT
jgi:hypothetical protein